MNFPPPGGSIRKRGDRLAKERAAFLEKLRSAYEYYYNVYDPEPAGDEARPLVFRAEFHARDEGYVLTKKLKLWGAESNEYVYLFSTPHLDAETAARCLDFAQADGLPRVTPHPEHKDSYIIAVFVADVIDPEAQSLIRSRRYEKSYKFGLQGWCALRTAAVELEKELVVTNKAGGNLVKFFKKLLRSENV